MALDEILEKRRQAYGDFDSICLTAQELKQALCKARAYRAVSSATDLDSSMLESLDMICHKMARIVHGDPTYPDNWVDIAGYAKLVADPLLGGGDD